jgi:hypothetical protein
VKKHYYNILIFLSISVIILLFAFGKNKPGVEKISEPMPDRQEEGAREENPESGSAESIAKHDPDWLLPDLEVMVLSEAYITTGSGGKRILRFPGTFMNTGDGPLELTGVPNKETNTIKAIQQIYKKDGTKQEKPVGNFVFHPTHDHWHFEDFVKFEIWSLKNGNGLDQKIAGTGKMTFCIHDYAPLAETYPGKPESAVYPWCDSSADIQGISVGWVDIYQADVPGQEIDITGLPDGIYAFRSVVDPENRILEKNEDNNSSVSIIEIEKGDVKISAADSDQELQQP